MIHLSPQLIKSLKKAFEPVLTDVRIDWYLPENMEAFLSPNEIPPLYPGNRLIGYCTLYDMTNIQKKSPEVYVTIFLQRTPVCVCLDEQISNKSILQSQGRCHDGVNRSSMGSVFGESNDELSPPPASEFMPVVTCADGTNLEEALREISREISSEFSCARNADPGTSPGESLTSGSPCE